MARAILFLITALELALMVWSMEMHSPIIPTLPPPPTYEPVVNSSLEVTIANPDSITVKENITVTIDCKPVIDFVRNLTSLNPRIVWYKNGIILTNGSEVNVYISKGNRLVIISQTSVAEGGQLGTSGNYTCCACVGDSNVDCTCNSTVKTVCGEPHLVSPANPPTIMPTFISLTFGQNFTAPTLEGVFSLVIVLNIFNGSQPLNTTFYKDGSFIMSSSSNSLIISNPTDNDFGTYTVIVSSERCGAAYAISRIIQDGIPPQIDKGFGTTLPSIIMQQNQRFKIGNQAYVFKGYNVTFDCNVVNGTSPITILWLHNDVEISSMEGNSSTITITDAEDGDNVSCRAVNSIGFDEATSTIRVEDCNLKCQNNGTLRDNCSCECPPDLTGMQCETKIDDCLCNPCQNDGTCIDGIQNYTCQCTEDFDGRDCEIYIGRCIENYMITNVDFDQPSFRVNEDIGSVELTLVLSKPMNCNCYVALTVRGTDVTAKRDEDFGPKADERVIFPNGITRETFRIPIIDDDDYEDSETFEVTVDPLSLPYGIAIGSTSKAEVTILDNDRATVKFKEVDCEVNEDIGSVKHTLVLNKALSANVTIRVDTVDQTTSSCDYEAGPLFIQIPAGKEEVSFNVSIKDDDTYETNESFQLVINRVRLPSRISRVRSYTSTVIIVENERSISVSFNESTYVFEHRGPIQPMLVLDKPSPCCLKVPVEVMSGTATGHDYDLGRNVSNVTLDITFPAGTTCAPFDIPIIDDIHSEANETFTVSIMNNSLPFGLKLEDPNNAVLTIVDNDYYVGFRNATYMVYEDVGLVDIIVEIQSNKTALTDIYVEIKEIKNTAENGTDYEPGPFNATIKKGQNSATFQVEIYNDTVYENGNEDNGEDFSLEIIADSLESDSDIHLGHISKTKVIIVDDEYTLSFGEGTYVLEEDIDEAKINLSVSRPLREDITVTFTYLDFTATGIDSTNDAKEIDYYASDEVIFPANTATINLTLKIVNDSRLEINELFRIIANPPEAPTGPPATVSTDIIIRDDDDFKVTFEKNHYFFNKNTNEPDIKLLLIYPESYNGSIMFPINVTIEDENGTATGPSADNSTADYVLNNNMVSYTEEENEKVILIRTIDDDKVEPDETFFLNIKEDSLTTGFSPGIPNSRVIIGDYGRVKITIVNDDVCTLRIIEKDVLNFGRPISEGVTLNITYEGDKQREIKVTAKETENNYPLGVPDCDIIKIQVIVPSYYNRDSIVAHDDDKDLITVIFVN